MFGERFHKLTETDRIQHFQGFNPDHEKNRSSPCSCGFQYLVYLDRRCKQLGKGLDLMDYQEDDHYDLDANKHDRQVGSSHYLTQAVRGLAEGITAPYHRHRFAIYTLFRFYLQDPPPLLPPGEDRRAICQDKDSSQLFHSHRGERA